MLRANKLLSYWPLETDGKFTKFNVYKQIDILKFIRKDIIVDNDLIVSGYYAYQYYLAKGNESNKIDLYVPYYDVISTDLENDVRMVSK